MTIKLGALIVKGTIPQPSAKKQESEFIRTLRFFDGLGKPLSSWEIAMLCQAEREGETK